MTKSLPAFICLPIAASLVFWAASNSYAADVEMNIIIKDHKFFPAELKVPAGQKVKLIIENQDATAEEFESHELNREKVIPPKAKLPVFIGPLTPGKYPFFGEFNQATARGVIIAE
jgi:plastocyanin